MKTNYTHLNNTEILRKKQAPTYKVQEGGRHKMQRTSTSTTYNRYAEIRITAGLRDADVSRESGVSPATLCDWKHGAYTPKYSTISKIAAVLGVEPQMILEGGAR